MIAVENLSKYYGKIKAVNGVSFNVEKGEIVGLLGPNGAGKTTIMRMLTCYFSPNSGTAKVDGFDCVNDAMEVKKRIGYMTENPLLYHEMRIRDFLMFMAKIRGINGNKIVERVDEVIEKLNLKEVSERIIGKLSRGYKQRVGLAQAILHDPPVLILDEPTTGLDPKQIIEIRDLIKSFGKDKTIILSSHILPEVSQICERIVIIDKGRIVAIDTHDQLLKRSKGTERIYAEIKGSFESMEVSLKKINGVKNVLSVEKTVNGRFIFNIDTDLEIDIREDLFKLAVQQGWIIYEMRKEIISLEDVFLKLTSDEAIKDYKITDLKI